MGTENTTGGNSSPGQSNSALDVNLSGMDAASLAGGGDPGFNLTESDTNNPEQFGQHTAKLDGQIDAANPNNPANKDGQGQTQGGAAGGQAESQPGAAGDQSGQAQTQTQGTQLPPGTDLAAIVRAVMTESMPAMTKAVVDANRAPATVEPARLSPDQIDAKFKVVRLSDEDMKVLGFEGASPQQKTALEGFAHKAAQMGAAIGQYHADQAIAALKQSLMPVLQHVATQQTQALKDSFYQKHQDLKEHEPLLVSIHAGLEKQGFQGTNEQWFEKIATTAKAILDRVRGNAGAGAGAGGSAAPGSSTSTTNGSPAGGGQTQQNQNGGQSTHRMTTLTGGGQGGAAGAANPGKKLEREWAVWED